MMKETLSSLIHVDLDNTIAIYGSAIKRVCAEKSFYYPENLITKKEISDYFKINGKNDVWTQIQGFCYGEYMKYADPAEDSFQILKQLKLLGFKLSLVSHKTKYPASGLSINLQDCAYKWLEKNFHGLFDERLFFPTKDEKVEYIQACNPSFLIDDLSEILEKVKLPKIQSILIHADTEGVSQSFVKCKNWRTAYKHILGVKGF